RRNPSGGDEACREQCPLWVKSGHLQCKTSCPLYPRKRHQMRHMECPLRDNSGHGLDYDRSGSKAATRGKITLISANSPGLVSTAIEPPCCLTMMSWLMESPSPVPSPAGLVVKNGLNIFSFTSGGMPVPLSRIVISTRSPRFLVAAAMVGS